MAKQITSVWHGKNMLWNDSNRLRYFLIPENQQLPYGNFIISNISGDERKADIIALTVWEISPSEAREYLQADMNQALETAKNAFSDFMLFAAQSLQPTEPNLISSVLGVNSQELQNKPEIAQAAVDNLYTKLKELLSESTLQNPDQIAIANSHINSLQETLQSQGINISEEMEELTNKLEEILGSPSIQQNLSLIFARVQNFLNDIDKSPEKLGETLDAIIQALSDDLLTAQEQQLEQERQQQYKQAAQDAIAESFRSLGIPSFAGDDLQLDTSQKGELTVNTSSQTDIQIQEKTPQKKSHILTILTPEEIAQFHQVSQMLAPYQRKKAQAITDKLKGIIITRLGELGEEIFTRAATFFLEVKLEAKNFKLIQRYSGLAGRTQLLLQRLNNWSEQHGELPVNSQGRIALVELDQIFWRIDERLQELPTGKFEGQQEVDLLIDIEEFREQLGVYERLIIKIDENPDIGLASTQ